MEFRKWVGQSTDGYELDMSEFSVEQVQALQTMHDNYKPVDHQTVEYQHQTVEYQHQTVEYQHLAFVRWLVTTGKLTDQIKETC